MIDNVCTWMHMKGIGEKNWEWNGWVKFEASEAYVGNGNQSSIGFFFKKKKKRSSWMKRLELGYSPLLFQTHTFALNSLDNVETLKDFVNKVM